MLILGILCADVFIISVWLLQLLMVVLAILVIVLLACGKGRSWLFNLFIFSSFLLLGGVLISNNRTINTPKITEKQSDLYSYMLHVSEINGPNREWRKAIGTIYSKVDSISCVNHKERVLLFLKNKSIQKGDHLLVYTDLDFIKNNNNPGEFNAVSFWKNKNIFRVGFVTDDDVHIIGHEDLSFIQLFLSKIHSALAEILELHLSKQNASLAKALILGDKDTLSTEVRSSFSNAGAMHVLAVSGLHVGIVLYILIYILGRFPKLFSKKSALIVSLVIIWIYAGVTGFSPSVLRASFMFSLLAIATVTGRRTNPMNILFFSAFVMLLINPLLIYSIGFQLSYLAMIGIFTLYIPLSRIFYIRNKWLKKIWEGTAVGIAAQIFTVPFTLYYFHQFPNYFAITNIGMMLFAGLVLGLGMLLFSMYWWPLASKVIGVFLAVSLTGMLFFVQFIENIPGSVAFGFTPSLVLITLLYGVGILALVYKLEDRIPILSLVALLILFGFVQYSRYTNLYAQEAVLFNNNDFAMAVKKGDRILCLYYSKKGLPKKTYRLFTDYQKVRPGTLDFKKLKRGRTEIIFDHDTLIFVMDKNGIEANMNGKEVQIRTSYGAQHPEGIRVIDMPYLEPNSKNENLLYGSITLTN